MRERSCGKGREEAGNGSLRAGDALWSRLRGREEDSSDLPACSGGMPVVHHNNFGSSQTSLLFPKSLFAEPSLDSVGRRLIQTAPLTEALKSSLHYLT